MKTSFKYKWMDYNDLLELIDIGKISVNVIGGYVYRCSYPQCNKNFKKTEIVNKDGYIIVYILYNKIRYVNVAHRIVWMYYNKKNIPNNLEVDHIDNDILNNKIDNLQLLTKHDNMKKSNRQNPRTAARNGMTKLNEKQVEQIRSSNEKSKKLALQFQVTSATIHNIKAGRTWGSTVNENDI